mgnify:FL=1
MARRKTIVRRFLPVMETVAHNFSPAALRQPSQPVAEAVAEGLLAARRAGRLEEWLRRHRRITAG